MKLSIPPEPTMLKNQSKKQINRREWDIDTIILWFGNRLPSYLWKEGGWSKPLKTEGYNWQSFLKILSLHKKEMIRWSRNSISWKEFLYNLQDTINDPVFKKILLG
jgi:hypothetical protein